MFNTEQSVFNLILATLSVIQDNVISKRKQYCEDLQSTVLGGIKQGRTVRSVSNPYGVGTTTIDS